jgi:hypothetical protein
MLGLQKARRRSCSTQEALRTLDSSRSLLFIDLAWFASSASSMAKRILALFDVDGTLTVPRKVWLANLILFTATHARRQRGSGQQLNQSLLLADCQPADAGLFAGAPQGETLEKLQPESGCS